VEDHLLAIDVGYFQIAQFRAAQGGGVERGDNRPVLQVVGSVEDARDLFRTQNRR
jgi:hypothetical protein